MLWDSNANHCTTTQPSVLLLHTASTVYVMQSSPSTVSLPHPGCRGQISTSHLLTVHHHPRQHLNASYLPVWFWGSFSLACLYPAHRLWHNLRFLLKWYCVCLLGRFWGRGQWRKGWNCWFYRSWHCLQFCFSAFQCIFIKDNVNNMSWNIRST